MITGAAAIMVVVFGAFMLADIVIIKSMGFGLALAVLIDATIVRGLLVPATMRLMGRWNWWAPAPVKGVVDRLGLGHARPGPARRRRRRGGLAVRHRSTAAPRSRGRTGAGVSVC